MRLLYVGHHPYSRLLSPVADLYVGHATQQPRAPSELSWGQQVGASDPTCWRRRRAESSPEKPQSLVSDFPFSSVWNFRFDCVSALQQSTLQRTEHPNCFCKSGFHTVKSSHKHTQARTHTHTGEVALRMPLRLGEVAPLSFFTGTRC